MNAIRFPIYGRVGNAIRLETPTDIRKPRRSQSREQFANSAKAWKVRPFYQAGELKPSQGGIEDVEEEIGVVRLKAHRRGKADGLAM
jgi:hypothetical protein